MRECERQGLAGENVVDWRFVAENGGIELVWISRTGGRFVMILDDVLKIKLSDCRSRWRLKWRQLDGEFKGISANSLLL